MQAKSHTLLHGRYISARELETVTPLAHDARLITSTERSEHRLYPIATDTTNPELLAQRRQIPLDEEPSLLNRRG